MNSNPKFKPMEHSAQEESEVPGLEVPGLEDLEAPPVEVQMNEEPEEHTKEHMLGDVQEEPPKVKRGKANMFPNAKSGKEGFRNMLATLKANPFKLVKYAGALAVVIGVAFMGYQLQASQNRIARLEKNATALYNVIKDVQKSGMSGSQAPSVDYTGAINELAGRLATLERRTVSLEQAPAPQAAPPAKNVEKLAAKAPKAAKSKTAAKAAKPTSRSLASAKKVSKKRR